MSDSLYITKYKKGIKGGLHENEYIGCEDNGWDIGKAYLITKK